MKNKLGDKCFADTMHVYEPYNPQSNSKEISNNVRLYAEVDGMHFDSDDYKNHKAWLNDIVKRVYKCAMGKLN